MPESLAGALEDLGHEVDSVNNLKLKGIDNGTLYRQVAVDYELCFTRNAGFAHNVRQMRDPSRVKVLCVIVPQQRVEALRSASGGHPSFAVSSRKLPRFDNSRNVEM